MGGSDENETFFNFVYVYFGPFPNTSLYEGLNVKNVYEGSNARSKVY